MGAGLSPAFAAFGRFNREFHVGDIVSDGVLPRVFNCRGVYVRGIDHPRFFGKRKREIARAAEEVKGVVIFRETRKLDYCFGKTLVLEKVRLRKRANSR